MDDLREVIARAIATANKTAVDPFAAEADAALAAIKQAGFAVVPAEPSEAMLFAGETGLSEAGVDDPNTGDALMCYRAMIEASNAPA